MKISSAQLKALQGMPLDKRWHVQWWEHCRFKTMQALKNAGLVECAQEWNSHLQKDRDTQWYCITDSGLEYLNSARGK